MRCIRKHSTSRPGEKSTRPFILSSMVRPRTMTGQTQRSGRKQTPLSASRSASTRSRQPACPPSRTPARRTPSGSSASINGSSSRSDGCRWRNGMPAPFPFPRTIWKAVYVTAASTCPPRRISRPLFWFSLPVMRTADTSSCRTSGCRRIRSTCASGATTFRMTCGSARAS